MRLSLLCLLLAGCSGSRDLTSKSDLAKQFYTFFAFEPPTSVSDLRARTVWVGDSMADWLSCKCDPEVFGRMIQSDGYKAATAHDLARWWETDIPDIDSPSPNAPPWWPKTPSTSISRLYYYSRPYQEGKYTQSSLAYFWRDEQSGVVFAYYSAWR